MRTVKLNTGVVINFDDDDNMLGVYLKDETIPPVKNTNLRYYVNQIKTIIK